MRNFGFFILLILLSSIYLAPEERVLKKVVFDSIIQPKKYVNISYSEAIRIAKKENKSVFFYFTGLACINARKMEQYYLTNENISKLISENYIFVSLFVDDRTLLKELEYVEFNGEQVELKTIGDRNNHLEKTKFKMNTQPLIGVVRFDGHIEGKIPYTKSVERFEMKLNELTQKCISWMESDK